MKLLDLIDKLETLKKNLAKPEMYNVYLKINKETCDLEDIECENDLTSITFKNSEHKFSRDILVDREFKVIMPGDKILFVTGNNELRKGIICKYGNMKSNGTIDMEVEIFDHSIHTYTLNNKQFIKYNQ